MMKREARHIMPEFILCLVSSFLCTLGLTLFIVDLLGLTSRFSPLASLNSCFLATLVILGFYLKPKIVLQILATLVIPLALILIFTDLFAFLTKTIEKFLTWLPPFLGQNATKKPDFEIALIVLVIVATTVLCFISFCILRSILAGFICMVLPILLLTLFTRANLPLVFMIPAVFGLFLMMMISAKDVLIPASAQKDRAGFLQSLPILLIFCVIGLACVITFSVWVPSSQLRRKEVANATDDTLSFLNIPLPDSTNHRTFNLGSLGFYPMGSQLGGPPMINERDVLRVTSSNDVLLRAISYNMYLGSYWSSNNYIFSTRLDSEPLKDRRIDFFDAERPNLPLVPPELYGALFEKYTIGVTNLTDKVGGTLFVPGHLQSLTVRNQTPYFNQSGEVYLREGVDAGQFYEATFTRLKINSETYEKDMLLLEAYLAEHPEARDSEEKLQDIKENNLAAEVPASVRDYALNITAGASTPLEKVFAIRQDLITNFTYELDVPEPPAGVDFVEHFLTTREGYCTYFATAMAVMARVNGIPARYVEGFIADVPENTIYYVSGATPAPTGSEEIRVSLNGVVTTPENMFSAFGGNYDDSGTVVYSPTGESTVVVTGREAHAWCEVYIDGIGWIPVDATAGPNGGGYSFTEERAQSVYVDTDGQAADDQEGYVPYRDITDKPVMNDNVPTTTTENSSRTGVILLAFVFAAILVATLIVASRYRRLASLAAVESRIRSMTEDEAIRLLYKRSIDLFLILRVHPEPHETPGEFAHRARYLPVYIPGVRKDAYIFEIQAITDVYERFLYGGKTPSAEEIDAAYRAWSALVKQIRGAHRLPFLFFLRLLITPETKPT